MGFLKSALLHHVGRRQRGQGMTEYIIIVALVAVMSIAVVTIFGDNVRALFGASANALAGRQNQGSLSHEAVTKVQVERKLENFNQGGP